MRIRGETDLLLKRRFDSKAVFDLSSSVLEAGGLTKNTQVWRLPL